MLRLFSPLIFFTVLWGDDGRILRYNLVSHLPDIYLVPASEAIGHTWVNGNVWDKPLIEKFYALLHAHDPHFVMIDLGAQTGSFSLLAKYFPQSQWYAFEPIQEAVDVLKENLFLNEIHNVSVYNMAVSDVAGWRMLKMPDQKEWGLATMGSNVLRFIPMSERRVECIDLDSFADLHLISKVHFMKLDTEGWELYILKGSKGLIRIDRPVILMEFNETNMKQCNVLKNEVEEFLCMMGYEWKLISSEDILCMPISKL